MQLRPFRNQFFYRSRTNPSGTGGISLNPGGIGGAAAFALALLYTISVTRSGVLANIAPTAQHSHHVP